MSPEGVLLPEEAPVIIVFYKEINSLAAVAHAPFAVGLIFCDGCHGSVTYGRGFLASFPKTCVVKLCKTMNFFENVDISR